MSAGGGEAWEGKCALGRKCQNLRCTTELPELECLSFISVSWIKYLNKKQLMVKGFILAHNSWL